jgi:hypothetical protein
MAAVASEAVGVRDPARDQRWPAIAGIVFVPLFVVGWLVSTGGVPDSDAPLADWVDWMTDSGSGAMALLSAYLLILAAIAFVVFAAGLVRRIRDAQGDGSLTASIVLGLSILGSALLASGGIAVNTGPIQRLFDDSVPDPTDIQVFIQIQSLGFGLALVGSALSVAAIIAIASASLRATVPRWFTMIGYVAAVVMLGSVMFLPMVVFPVWVLIASILMLRRTSRTLGARTT